MSEKGKASDFGKLFAARSNTSKHSDIQTSKHLDIPKTKSSKSKDPNYQRTTVYLPKELHRRLKFVALTSDREMSEVIATLVSEWLDTQEPETPGHS